MVGAPFVIVGTSSCCKGTNFGSIRSCLMGNKGSYVMNFILGGALSSGNNIAHKVYGVSKRRGLARIIRAGGVMGVKGDMRTSNIAVGAGSLISVGV